MNLDMGLVALLTAGCSLFGLPWLVAATVRSLAHVKSLTNYEQLGGGEERVSGVVEQRYGGSRGVQHPGTSFMYPAAKIMMSLV